MEGVTLEKAIFSFTTLLSCLFIDSGDSFYRCDYMLPKPFPVFDGFRFKESTTKYFGNVFFDHRLYSFLTLSLENVIQFSL
jgi:hypothetical protein